jgi:hypothetical protein
MHEWVRASVETEENRSTQRKTSLNATLSTTDATQTVLGLNPGLCIERGWQITALAMAQYVIKSRKMK